MEDNENFTNIHSRVNQTGMSEKIQFASYVELAYTSCQRRRSQIPQLTYFQVLFGRVIILHYFSISQQVKMEILFEIIP